MDLVADRENLEVSVLVEAQLSYVVPYYYGKLFPEHPPHLSGTAVAIQLGNAVTDVVHQFFSKLGGFTCHNPGFRSSVRLLWFGTIQIDQLCFNAFVDISSRLGFVLFE